MSEIEQVKAEAETENKQPQKEPWLKKYAPSWWVFQQKPEKVKKPWQQELIEWGGTLVVALIVALLVRTFIFEPVRVDGDSMYPTLHHGEFMYVSKLDYGTSFIGIPFTGIGTYVTVGGEPERFDVVVCNYPDRLAANGSRLNFVKRVVGLPGNVSFCFEGIEGESLLLLLDMKGVCASSGSACTSGSLDPSHVLLAIGRVHDVAHGSLRLSLSEYNTDEEVDHILTAVPEVVAYLRGISPVWRDLQTGKREYIL